MGVGARLEERMLGEFLLTENDFFFFIGETALCWKWIIDLNGPTPRLF